MSLLPSRRPEANAARSRRSSVHREEEKALQRRLIRAMLDFTATQLGSVGEGALLQMWTPIQTLDGSVVLTAQGSPFSVCGVGDLLALYRMLSAGYRFSTDIHQPDKMGAIGRVFHSTEPEMTGDVQKYPQEIFLRVAEAQRCQVRSLMAIPIFDDKYPGQPLAVFELANTRRDTHFPEVMGALMRSLESVNLGTTDMEMRALKSSLRQLPSQCAAANKSNSRPSVDRKSANYEPLYTRAESQEAADEGADRERTCKRSVSDEGNARMRTRVVPLSPFAAPSESTVCSHPHIDCLEDSTRVTPASSSDSSFYTPKSEEGLLQAGRSGNRRASLQHMASPVALHKKTSQPEPLPSSINLQTQASSPAPPTAPLAVPHGSSSTLTREAQAMRLLAWLNPPRRKQQREDFREGSSL